MATAALQHAGGAAPQALVGRAVVLPLGTFAIGALTIALLAGGRVSGGDPAVVVLAACLSFPVAAAVLLDRSPRHPVGTALSAPGLVPLVGALSAWPGTGDRPLPADTLAGTAVPTVVLVAVVLVALPLSLLHEPLRGSTTGAVSAAGSAVLLVLATSALQGRAPALELATAIPTGAALGLSSVLLAGAVVAAHAAVVLRWSRATGVERDRLAWYVAGAAALALSACPLVGWIASGAPPLAFYAAGGLLLLVPVGVLALVLTPVPPAFDRALARIAASVLLMLLLAGVYVAAVAGLAATGLPDRPQGAAVLTCTAALVAVPLWGRCREALETRLFGAGRSPAQVLAALEARLAVEAADPLQAITGWVAAAVRSPAVHVADEPPPAGTGGAAALVVPLRAGGGVFGHLVVAPRHPGERYSTRDRRLLEQLALPVALVARTAMVNEELARSEQRIAAARRRERRRVLDDLHDDLGPALAGIGMQLSAARNRLGDQDASPADERRPEAVALLDSAVLAAEQARTVMRRLVRDLDAAGPTSSAGTTARPLGPALAELAQGWSTAAGLHVELADASGLPTLPAAVEQAAYRIAGEAVTNVVRHAHARHCTLRAHVRTSEAGRQELVVQVEDDGRTGGPWLPGVGMRSMRQRAGGLGGSVDLRSRTGGGTVVTARLPLSGPTGLS